MSGRNMYQPKIIACAPSNSNSSQTNAIQTKSIRNPKRRHLNRTNTTAVEFAMVIPTGTTPRTNRRRDARKGAIVPMFAILLPVLLIFCGFAINLAYMQVVTTELKIATDCAAHAGGRAMSVAQG